MIIEYTSGFHSDIYRQDAVLYTQWMGRKTTIDVDDDLLAQAQEVLGTTGLKATVDTALSEVVRASRRRELSRQLETGAGLDFDEATKEAARRWRT